MGQSPPPPTLWAFALPSCSPSLLSSEALSSRDALLDVNSAAILSRLLSGGVVTCTSLPHTAWCLGQSLPPTWSPREGRAMPSFLVLALPRAQHDLRESFPN